LEIAVPRDNPARVSGLADLARAGVKVALCARQVPCGAAAGKALAAAHVAVRPVSWEPDVKAALSRVRLGEVDAALVYRTDVRAAGSAVHGIEFPESADAVNSYPIGTLAVASHRAAADAFVAYVRSADARAVFLAAGFDPP
jgi:molybdate transport system substrate-binding protein